MKRSTPLRRTAMRVWSTLRRTSPMRGHGGKSKHARRDRGWNFMGWTARQPCMVRRFFWRLHRAAVGETWTPVRVADLDCAGVVEADHAGDRFSQGDGTRAYDRTCIPLCTKHHRMRTSWAGTLGQAGIFFGFSREALRRWCDAAIAIHHALAQSARIEVPSC